MNPIVPAILGGGSGARLWPASRASYPKQFLPLLGEASSFRTTLERVNDPRLFARPLVVAGDPHRFIVLHELEAAGMEACILIEPAPRDSGPAILAAAISAMRTDESSVVLALAADHAITDAEGFREDCALAAGAAAEGYIVTFGVRPDRPATEYGYIKPGEAIAGSERIRRAVSFVEKPDLCRAQAFVEGGHVWNSGNFCFQASVLVEEYRRFDPDTVEAIERSLDASWTDFRFLRLGEAAYQGAAKRSIDYAVMERTERAVVLPARFGWADIGSWQSLWRLKSKDAQGNVASGPVVLRDVSGSYIEAEEHVLTAILGLKDVVVVVASDAVLVAARDRVHEIKDLVASMQRENRAQATEHLRVHRPWGWYQRIDLGDRFQVKRITVRPGGRLSLQKHFHRAEHWVVVKGTAAITVAGEVRLLHENQSTYIPIGEMHRLENPGRIDLELIEVQSGSYTGEDDIVRLEDIYER